MDSLPTPQDPRTAQVVAFFESMTTQSLEQLPAIYHPEASFQDPFNHVLSVTHIDRIFRHMFTAVDRPRFVVLSAITQANEAFLTWDFSFYKKGLGEVKIHGASRLLYGADGRVTLHRDYWDAVAELYSKLPVLGPFFKWLAKQFSTPVKA